MKAKTKKLNWKVCLIALAVGAIVFIFTFADQSKTDKSDFHEIVAGSFIGRSLTSLDYKINDIYQPDNNPSDLPIIVIGIDDYTRDREHLGDNRFWSRDVYARLLDTIHYTGDPDDPDDDVHPAVVCFDILFDRDMESEQETDMIFADACAKYQDTIQGAYYEFNKGQRAIEEGPIKNIVLPYPELLAASRIGCTTNRIENDGYARTVFVDVYSDPPMDSLGLAAYKAYLEYTGEPYIPHRFLTDTKKDVYFTYSRKVNKNSHPFTYKSFYDVYELANITDKEEYVRRINEFDGAIVFIGAYYAGCEDDFFTPVSNDKMYGVDIHAMTCEAIAMGKLQVYADRTITAIIYALIAMFLVIWVYVSSLALAVTGSVAAIVLDLLANFILHKTGYYLPVVYLIVPAVIILTAAIVLHYLVARAEKAKINDAFKMYVAPEVVDEMSKDGSFEMKLGGQTKDIAVLFIDIRGFTTMSEGLHPEEVVSILNEYFGLVTDAIFKNKGTLDKFIGDAAMAVFNSPNDLDDYVYRAVHTAWDIALGSQELAQKLLEKHGRTINYGIGVNCGPATIGNIGSEFRMDFTAIGDTVNTSARLEANAKAGQILISQAVYDIVKDWIETEDIGTIPLKGKSNEIYVYNVTKVTDKPGYLENRVSITGKKKSKAAAQ